MRKYLVLVDMQNDFIDGALGTPEALEIVPKVIEKLFAEKEAILIFTQDTHEAEYLSTQEGQNLPVEHCTRLTSGWNIHSTLQPYAKHSRCIMKNTFGSKELAEHLTVEHEILPIDEIELCGLCTDICVISNALLIKAFLPEVKIKVDASCCAGVTPESHKNALNAMKMCQIDITNE